MLNRGNQFIKRLVPRKTLNFIRARDFAAALDSVYQRKGPRFLTFRLHPPPDTEECSPSVSTTRGAHLLSGADKCLTTKNTLLTKLR